MADIQINPTFGASQTVQVPTAPVQAPPVQMQQVYSPNSANIINGNEASFASQNTNAVQTSTTGNIVSPTGTETIGGTNPLIWNSPIYVANGIGDHNAPADNPNARLAKEAEKQKKNPNQNKDKKSELNEGGSKQHTITPKEIKELEKQTNLSLYPYIFGGELARIKHQFSSMNQNKYYLLLNMLVYGFDNKVLQSGLYGHDKYVIDKAFLNDFLKMAKIPQLQEALKKTPAYQKGCFNDLGKLGVTQANANNMNTNPITGPKTEHPSLVTALMDKIHPNAVAELDSFCNSVRTSAWLSLPKRAFAAIQSLVSAINGVIAAFQKLIMDIYNGIMKYIQQIIGLINGLIAKIQQLIMDFLESIIPVDLLCILLAILQQMAGDIPFFSSLMNMSNITNQFTSTFQNYAHGEFGLGSVAGGLNSNPLSMVSKYLPQQVNQVIQTVTNLQNNPSAYLSGMLSNFGYGMAAQGVQGKVLGSLLTQMGPTFVGLHPLAKPLGATEDTNPKAPDSVGPTIHKNNTEDIYGQPLEASKIKANVAGGGSGGASDEAKKAFNNAANPASAYTEPLNFKATPPNTSQVGIDVSGVSTGNIA
jgi:hypothetical protein